MRGIFIVKYVEAAGGCGPVGPSKCRLCCTATVSSFSVSWLKFLFSFPEICSVYILPVVGVENSCFMF